MTKMVDQLQGMKIYADKEKNKIDSNFILKIINDLSLLSNYILQHDLFSAGFHLGRLQGDFVFLKEQMEIQEKNFEQSEMEVDDEPEIKEENFDSYTLLNSIEKYRENEMKMTVEIIDRESKIVNLKHLLMDLQDLLLCLLKYKGINNIHVPEVINSLIKSGVEDIDLKVRGGQELS